MQSARPLATNPEATAAARSRFVAKTRQILAVVLGVSLAVCTPLFLPEAKGMSPLLAGLGGGVVGLAVGWIMGHLMGTTIWMAAMPRDKP